MDQELVPFLVSHGHNFDDRVLYVDIENDAKVFDT